MLDLWNHKDQICETKPGKLIEPSPAGGSLFNINNSHSFGEIAFKGLANSGAYLAKKGLASAVKSDFAKRKIKRVANKYLDQALDSFTSDLSKKINGGAIDIQKHLSKLGELHMRTPTGKKYNYCGPGTKLEERLTSDDPKYRDPINNLDRVCQQHDIAYSEAKSLKDKHNADDVMLDEISKIPYMKRPLGTTAVQAMIAGKRKLGLGVKTKEVKKRQKPSSEEKNWQEKLADELHKPIKRNFTRRRVIANHIDEKWSADLVFMDKLVEMQQGFQIFINSNRCI